MHDTARLVQGYVRVAGGVIVHYPSAHLVSEALDVYFSLCNGDWMGMRAGLTIGTA